MKTTKIKPPHNYPIIKEDKMIVKFKSSKGNKTFHNVIACEHDDKYNYMVVTERIYHHEITNTVKDDVIDSIECTYADGTVKIISGEYRGLKL